MPVTCSRGRSSCSSWTVPVAEHREKCTRCRRPYRGRGDWNIKFKLGKAIGLICPRCHSPEENAEAAVHEAVYDYSSAQIRDGRLYVPVGGHDG